MPGAVSQQRPPSDGDLREQEQEALGLRRARGPALRHRLRPRSEKAEEDPAVRGICQPGGHFAGLLTRFKVLVGARWSSGLQPCLLLLGEEQGAFDFWYFSLANTPN